MCGNGIRCVGKYVYEKGYTDKRKLTVETLSGIRRLNLETLNGRVRGVSVDMGSYEVDAERTLRVGTDTVTLTPVSVGNPHAVLFVRDAESAPVDTLGPRIERHENFPDGVNVEFVQVLTQDALRMRVWERGSGVTMACGTGACASVAAAVSRGYCLPDTSVRVLLDGGTLTVTAHTDGTLTMTGPAVTVYEGETEIC